jgi:dipeptidyl aminopeptidase/acylaminoacyl peptidase
VRPALPVLERAIPGFAEFIRFSSPKTHVDKLKCPVFLFHAQDDNVVPYQQSAEFAERLKNVNQQVTFVSTPQGGHYDSMIREGVPKAIDWLKKLPQ